MFAHAHLCCVWSTDRRIRARQVACIVIMLTGVLVFGTLLAEVEVSYRSDGCGKRWSASLTCRWFQAGVSELRRTALEKGHKLHRKEPEPPY